MAITTKAARLNLRLRSSDDELIRRAAALRGESVSEFVASTARERALELLADQREFVLESPQWDVFLELLDRPAQPDSRLVELFSRPRRIEG